MIAPLDTLAQVDQIRRQLAASRRELRNPVLLKITRECIADRIRRLERELAALCPEPKILSFQPEPAER